MPTQEEEVKSVATTTPATPINTNKTEPKTPAVAAKIDSTPTPTPASDVKPNPAVANSNTPAKNNSNGPTPNQNGANKQPNANQNKNHNNNKNRPNQNPNNKNNFNKNKQNNNNKPQQQHKFQNQNGHKSAEMNGSAKAAIAQAQTGSAANSQQQQQQQEKKFTGRCRLFVGNLPSDITEKEFTELFTKYGEVGECFLNTQRSFGFIKLDTRINAEHAKQVLDGFTFKGRCIRVRFASHGAAVRVKNLSPYISNEYLEQAFSMFGPVERAVVIVDDKGRPTGEGIVEFERKPAAAQCINKCIESCFILTNYPKPVIVEPLDQKDDEDGLPEKSLIKNAQYHSERESGPHFAPNGSIEHKLALRWRELFDLEKQISEEGKKRVDQAREMLEYEVEQALMDQRTLKLKEDLRAKQEELQRIEDMKRRQEEDNRRRQEEMMMRKQQQQQHGNGRMNNGGMSLMNSNGPMQQQYHDAPLLNQPHQLPVNGGGMGPQGGGGGNNRRYEQNQAGGYNQQQHHQHQQQQMGQMNQMNQQQAMLAAFAMAAAAQGNLNMPMYDNQPNNMNKKGGQRNDNPNDNRINNNNNNNNRRQFDRRGGRMHANRDDQSPYPGYDTKRARY